MDFKHEPLIIFKTTGPDDILIKKIALHVTIGTSGGNTSSEPVGESIVLFSEEKLIAFSYIFIYTNQNTQEKKAYNLALVLVAQEKDRLQLFKNKIAISTKFKFLSYIIQKDWHFGTKLNEGIQHDFIEYLKQINTEMKNGTSQFLSTIIEEDNIFQPNIGFFQNLFVKEFSSIIYTVVTGKKMAVFAKDINTATLAISTIELFCPQRNIIKKVWVETYSPDYELFAGPHSLIGTIPSDIPYIDLTGKKTSHLIENNYFAPLIEKVISMDLRHTRQIIEQEMNQLLVEVGQILTEIYGEIKKIEDNQSDESGFRIILKKYKSKYSPEKLALLLDLMDQHDSRLSPRIKRSLSTV